VEDIDFGVDFCCWKFKPIEKFGFGKEKIC
jgi:hypothetical protein